MFNIIRGYLISILLFSLIGASFFGSILKSPTMVTICFTIASMDIAMMFLCFIAYRAGRGQPKPLEEMPINIPHKVEYHYSNGNYSVIGLRKCTVISQEHMLIKINDEVILYLGKIPELPASTVFKPEYVALATFGYKNVLGWINIDSYKEHK